MAKVIHQAFFTAINHPASTTRYMPVGCNPRASNDVSTEANAKHTWRSAGVLTNLFFKVTANDRGASTLRTRKATANANLIISIGSSTTGLFEDAGNRDSVGAGDDWHISLVTGAGGTIFEYRTYSVLFSAAVNTVSRIGSDGNNTVSAASSTQTAPLAGDGNHTAAGTDANMGVTFRTAGTLANMHVNIASNARTTTTTMRSRKNSANGNLSISIGASITGVLEDTSNSDAIAVNDLVNIAFVTGTGTENLVPGFMFADFTTTNNQVMYTAAAGTGNVVNANVTTYYGFSGGLRTTTTETNMQAEANHLFRASLMQCVVSANTVTLNSTITFRKNTADGNQTLSITASTTGVFQDVTNTDTIVPADVLAYKLVTGATGTSLTLTSISVLGDATASLAVYRKTLSPLGTRTGTRQVRCN